VVVKVIVRRVAEDIDPLGCVEFPDIGFVRNVGEFVLKEWGVTFLDSHQGLGLVNLKGLRPGAQGTGQGETKAMNCLHGKSSFF